MDVRGLERELRKLPGVVSCAVTAEAVSVLLSEDADAKTVAKEAASLAVALGAPSVRILESPASMGAARPPARSLRPRVAAATAFAAAIALIATLVPIGKKVTPRVASPAAIRPAPAPAGGGVLPPVLMPQPPTQRRSTGSGAGFGVASGAAVGTEGVGTPGVATPGVSKPGTVTQPAPAPRPVSPAQPADCDSKGNAWGRTNHEGDGNESHHRHHTHASAHHREHWFDCT